MHLLLGSGRLAGYWVRESARAFVPGKVGDRHYDATRTLVFNSATQVAYRFGGGWLRVTDVLRRTTDAGDRAPTVRKAVINGVRHQYLSAGSWSGWWVRFRRGMELRLRAPDAPTVPTSSNVVGYGAGTSGGAGGRQLAVTTLADSGPGSLRAALEASGKRIVVFGVAGTIRLQSTITIKDPYVTVAGETAPAPGITLRDGALMVRTSEVILRHLRLRPGDQVDSPDDVDALTINGANGTVSNVVVDHVTMLWGPDIGGLAVLGDVRNLTVQHSIMGEGLYLSAHSEGTAGQGGHSHAANITQLSGSLAAPQRLTFWRNLFTTANTRIPRFQGAACVDVINNVIYNWGRDAAHGNPRSLNLVNNWFRAGPETESRLFWKVQTSDVTPQAFSDAVYLAGNVADGFNGARDEAPGVYVGSPRCGGLSAPAGDPAAAYAAVLDGVGAIAPGRDEVDRRLIANVRNRTGRFVNGTGYPALNPYWP
jgi:pectate lyase